MNINYILKQKHISGNDLVTEFDDHEPRVGRHIRKQILCRFNKATMPSNNPVNQFKASEFETRLNHDFLWAFLISTTVK